MIEAARGLGARRHVCALLGRPETAWLRAAEKQGVPVRAEIRGAWIQRVLRVRAAMRDFRPDVVVAKAKKAARVAAFGRSTGSGGRAVLFFGATHELEADRAFDRLTWRALDAGIVVATAAAEWYVERGFGPREKFHVLWKGVEASDFDRAAGRAAATRTALGLEAADLAIGTVGRLAWQKGLDDLLAAARLVCARVPRARFFVIGGGRDAAQVAAAAASTPPPTTCSIAAWRSSGRSSLPASAVLQGSDTLPDATPEPLLRAGPRRWLIAGFPALRHRNFRLFIAGQSVSLIGTWMQSVAQSWLVYRLSGSRFALGLVAFAGYLPILCLAPAAGVIADRVERQRLIVITQTLAMGLALALGLLVAARVVTVPLVVLVAGCLGAVSAFDIPLRQSFIVELVGAEDLPNAIALNSS